jgi:hypothetical protein
MSYLAGTLRSPHCVIDLSRHRSRYSAGPCQQRCAAPVAKQGVANLWRRLRRNSLQSARPDQRLQREPAGVSMAVGNSWKVRLDPGSNTTRQGRRYLFHRILEPSLRARRANREAALVVGSRTRTPHQHRHRLRVLFSPKESRLGDVWGQGIHRLEGRTTRGPRDADRTTRLGGSDHTCR